VAVITDRHVIRARGDVAARAPGRDLLLILWIGLVAGLGEALLLGIARFGLGRYTHLPPDLVWMSPVASMVVFGVVGIAMLAVGKIFRPIGSFRALILTLSFLLFLNTLLLVTQLHQAAALVLAAGLAVQTTRLASRHDRLLDNIVRYSLLPFLIIVLLGGAGFAVAKHHKEQRLLATLPSAARGAPNILFVIWDTVRSTNLSIFGYGRATTPFLNRLAARSVVFDRAVAPASWTLPSHASLFTGALPHEVEADWAQPLEEGRRTLAEYFRQRGYLTGGFVGNTYYCSDESGLNRGFIRYDDFVRSDFSQILMGSALLRTLYGKYPLRHLLGLDEEPGRKSARRVNQELLDWLQHDDARPFFAFLNYFDAHAPYLPPPPYDTLFGPRRPRRNPLISEEREMTQAELSAEVDAYDGAIRYMDDALRRLLDNLQRSGKLENTIVVVTADHGEQFGEHGLVNHGNSLYMPLLHVPLVIYAPGRIPGGVRVTSWISTRDIAATLADLAARDSAAFPGESLAHQWRNASTMNSGHVQSEVSQASGLPPQYPAAHGDMTSVISGGFQLITSTAGTEQLFDLARDPAQQRDLSSNQEFQSLKTSLRGSVVMPER